MFYSYYIANEHGVIKMEHLNALMANLNREQARLDNAKSENEIAMRTVWVNQLKKEIAAEKEFIGYFECKISDDELLAELMK
jgi:hypothetical protein